MTTVEILEVLFESEQRAAKIRACQHPHPKAAGHGYALCDDCGALLPDEDPDLRSKCEGWKPITTEPKDGSPIWMCHMVDGEPRDIRPGISSHLPPSWPTHWKPRGL